jgi:hypothetical protein
LHEENNKKPRKRKMIFGKFFITMGSGKKINGARLYAACAKIKPFC